MNESINESINESMNEQTGTIKPFISLPQSVRPMLTTVVTVKHF